jgi:molybdate transport system permease protein
MEARVTRGRRALLIIDIPFMPVDFASACLLTALALIAGAALSFLVIGRTDQFWFGEIFLRVLVLVPWIVLSAVRWPAAGLAAWILAAAPVVAVFGADGVETTRECCNAARSLGASEWRVFWRVFLPTQRFGLMVGALLACARVLMERGIAMDL